MSPVRNNPDLSGCRRALRAGRISNGVSGKMKNKKILELETVIESMGDGISLSDANGHFEIFNSKMQEITGYTIEEANSCGDFSTLIYPDPKERQKALEGLKKIRRGKDHKVETTIRAKDGSKKALLVSTTLVGYKDRDMFLSVYRDITEREMIEDELLKSRERFIQVADIAEEFIWEVDTNGLYTYASPAVEKILGYKPEELTGKKHFYDFFAPDVREELKKAAFEVFARKDSFKHFNNPNLHKNGKTVIMETSGGPVMDKDGNLLGYCGADIDITERKKAEEELKKSKEKLEIQAWGQQKTNEAIKLLYKELDTMNKKLQQVDQMKSDFVSHVSHELRTPLATMREANAQLLEGMRGPLNEAQRRYMEISQRGVDRLTRIINNLLDLSRLDAGKIKLERKSVDITILARDVMESLLPQADQKKIKLEDELPPSLPETFIDPDRIRQVLINLVGNALKYTKEGGKIKLSAKRKEGSLEVSVIDTGMGIPDDYLDKIFERFERVSKIPIPGVGGAGLGLAICKELLDLHKGSICVESRVGKGSRFIISLPIYKEKDFLLDYLGEQIQEVKKIHSFLSLIMINVENCSQLKKKWGVKTMTQVQKQLEDLISSYIRDPMDKVIRYKEDTLALVMIGTPKKNGQAVAERLNAQTKKYKFKAKDKTVSLSLRFKEVTYPADGQTEDELIKAVEK